MKAKNVEVGLDFKLKNDEMCGNIVYFNRYQAVFCTRRREPILTGSVALRVREVIEDYATENKISIEYVDITPDCVSMFFAISPQLSIHSAITRLKRQVSRVLNEDFPTKVPDPGFLWTSSYYTTTLSGACNDLIAKYVEAQSKTL